MIRSVFGCVTLHQNIIVSATRGSSAEQSIKRGPVLTTLSDPSRLRGKPNTLLASHAFRMATSTSRQSTHVCASDILRRIIRYTKSRHLVLSAHLEASDHVDAFSDAVGSEHGTFRAHERLRRAFSARRVWSAYGDVRACLVLVLHLHRVWHYCNNSRRRRRARHPRRARKNLKKVCSAYVLLARRDHFLLFLAVEGGSTGSPP